MNTRQDAENLILFLKGQNIHAKIIGSLQYGKESAHDIDICIIPPSIDGNILRMALKKILHNSNTKLVLTEWDGMFFYNTYWGNIDIFFKMPTGMMQEFLDA